MCDALAAMTHDLYRYTGRQKGKPQSLTTSGSRGKGISTPRSGHRGHSCTRRTTNVAAQGATKFDAQSTGISMPHCESELMVMEMLCS